MKMFTKSLSIILSAYFNASHGPDNKIKDMKNIRFGNCMGDQKYDQMFQLYGSSKILSDLPIVWVLKILPNLPIVLVLKILPDLPIVWVLKI